MVVQVRLFALLRERAGRESVELRLDDGATVGEAIDAIGRDHGLGDVIERMPVVMAVNREYAGDELVLREGDELALIPPVSGGAASVRVTEEPLSVERLSRLVARPGAGAIVTFQGTTRDVESLYYEAYREMAEERMEEIVAEAVEGHGVEAAAAEHRVGTVPLGEASVVVVVSSAHRAEAFAAAREIIDRIKSEAPIWKKEIESGAERWVEGEAPPEVRPEQVPGFGHGA
jgi:MoaE-MoaD fusion protein